MIDSGGADREPDVESGGRDLEQRAEEHLGSVPGPGGERQGAERVLSGRILRGSNGPELPKGSRAVFFNHSINQSFLVRMEGAYPVVGDGST